MDLLIVSGLGVDVNVSLNADDWPLPAEADTVFVAGTEVGPGHAGSGVALQSSALGLDVTVVDVIGDDAFGGWLREWFPARGVRLATVEHAAGTRRSVNLVRADGRRLSLHDTRHPADFRPDPDLWRPALREARWAHIVIVDWTRLALRDAIAAGVPTSTDLQDWDGVSEHHREFALGADLVFCSAVNLADRASDVAAGLFDEGRAQAVVVTAGPDGATVFRRGQSPLTVPAVTLPGLPVVDTNGAGDAFGAVFAAAWRDGLDPVEAGRRASIAAAYTCAFAGTNTRHITGEELAELAARD